LSAAFCRPSDLYSLQPVGVGSGLVESLTGYIARLAQEHCIYPNTLTSTILLPELGKAYLQNGSKLGGSFWSKMVAINGTGTWAADLVRLLERLTGRTDLRCLTLLQWSSILSPRGLLRRTRAWCPLCLAQWSESQQPVYEPLAWALDVITHCPIHRQPLQVLCPHKECSRRQPLLAARMRPGYCSSCLRWLGLTGETGGAATSPFPSLEHQQQVKIWAYVEGMLSATPSGQATYPQEKLASVLGDHREVHFDGDSREFARHLGVSRRSIVDLASGIQAPQLATLLKICERLGTTPIQLVSSEYEVSPQPPIAKALAQPAVYVLGTERRRKKRHRRFDRPTVERALRAAMNVRTEPPLPMRAVAHSLGYDPSYLSRQFPHICRYISRRYRRYIARKKRERVMSMCMEVRRVTKALGDAGEFPSYRRVRGALGKARVMHEPEALATWHATLKEHGWAR
jgi:transcriptional regulator with XRE-family HTH domain